MKYVATAAVAAIACLSHVPVHAETAAPVAEADDGGAAGGEIIVTGTRRSDRTAFDTAAPIDVVTGEALQSVVSDQIMTKLAATTPSFNVQRLPTADGQQYVRPATLRGLSPDQTLVLVNGKRRHRSAFLGSRGAQGVDLAQLNTIGIGRIEVLRDGASAQYGSDAIAGVINIILSPEPGFAATAQASQYYAGDGELFQGAVRYGVRLGDGGHVVASLDYTNAGLTSRTRQRADAIAFQAANPNLKVPDPVQRWGQPDREVWRLAVDSMLPLGEGIELYAFGTYANSTGVNDFNWRNPATDGAYRTSPVFPGWNLRSLYPTGFSPRFGQDEIDYAVNGGVRGLLGALHWDLGVSKQRDKIDYFLRNSINASFGPESPTSFRPGVLIQDEFNLNADFTLPVTLGFLADTANLAFGAERRVETYKIKAGDPFSYKVGPGAVSGLPSGSNGFPGYSDSQAGSWGQTSYAAYADFDMPITRRFSADFAVRYEHFSEFGSTTNGKAALRYEITPDIAVRGTVSSGFRAPTPGQVNSTRTSQGLDTTTLQLFTAGRLSVLNPVAIFFGAKPLKPEKSMNYSVGIAARRGGFSGSLDFYQIDVDDRFSTSPNFTVTPTIRAQLIAQGVPGADQLTSLSYFTNAFDTRTRGIDAVLSYRTRIGEGTLNLTTAWNYNHTKVTRFKTTDLSELSRINVESSLPKVAGNATIDYRRGRFDAMLRGRFFGSWTDAQFQDSKNLVQKFGARAFVDIAFGYRITDQVKLTVGAENLFDTYPDKATFQASRGLVYSRNAAYDTDGGLYYARLSLNF